MSDYGDRHPGVQSLMKWLAPNPKLPPAQRALVGVIHTLADGMLDNIGDCPELTEGLRKLLEAKDCFVRASMDASLSGDLG